MSTTWLLAALLCGLASGAHVQKRDPYWLGLGGGTTLVIRGYGFSLNHFDENKGNKVKLVNDEDTIDCKVIPYYTNGRKITCKTGKKTNTKANPIYNVKVYVAGKEATGSKSVEFTEKDTPWIASISPRSSLPNSLITMEGHFRTNRYKELKNVEGLTEENLEKGSLLTQVYMGKAICKMINKANDDLYGNLTYNNLTCLMEGNEVGPMNGSIYVNEHGLSKPIKDDLRVDSKDTLYQFQMYAGVESVTPRQGSPGGMTLITVSGTGFNSKLGATAVRVGGAECKIQTIDYNTITCWTPPVSETMPGPGERGFLLELWKTGSGNDLSIADEWMNLNSSHPNYSSEIKQDADFSIEMNETFAGKISTYLTVPHTGLFSLALKITKGKTALYVATDGNPDNLVYFENWDNTTLKKDTPAYIEARFKSKGSIQVILHLIDYRGNYAASQCGMCVNEAQLVTFDLEKKPDVQTLTINGNPVDSKLVLNGWTSPPVDLSNADEIRNALLDLVEQECKTIASDQSSIILFGFEDGKTPIGALGQIVDTTYPFCGRKLFQTYNTNTRLYYEKEVSKMVKINEFPYLCFAVKGNIQKNMVVLVYWTDKTTKKLKATDILFDHSFSSDAHTWSYQCHNLETIIQDSSIGSSYDPKKPLLLSRILAPKPLNKRDDVFADELGIHKKLNLVTPTYPSALKENGILIRDIIVAEVERSNTPSFDVTFESSNCVGRIPLIGVTDGEANSTWSTTLKYPAASHVFPVNGGDVEVTRTANATDEPQGTWDIHFQNTTISEIPLDVASSDLEEIMETTLGTSGILVKKYGECHNRKYIVKWTEDPGMKSLMDITHNITSDGDFSVTSEKKQHGRTNHGGVAGDFLRVPRIEPSVSVEVNNYTGVCLENCSYDYSSSGVPIVTSVTGEVDISGTHFVTIAGTGFTRTILVDYTVTVGSTPCLVNAVSTTSVDCSMREIVSGIHGVEVVMQPLGAAIQPNPVLTYQVDLEVLSINPTTGGTGGGNSITITGSGFPPVLEEWNGNSVFVGDAPCEVTGASSTTVICTVPSGPDGVADVHVNVSSLMTTIPNSFTYDASLSAVLTGVTPSSSSVLGGGLLTITGSDFGNGTGSTVKVGPSDCLVMDWTDMLINCALPVNNPGKHAVSVFTPTNGFARGSASVTYTLKVTGSSASTGSINGGTLMKITGEGFGTDPSKLQINIGEKMICDVRECTDTQITCMTKLVTKRHKVTNMGSRLGYGPGYEWDPKLLTVTEGDTVQISWEQVANLQYSVYQIAFPATDAYDGAGFHSGNPRPNGSMIVELPKKGSVSYKSNDVISGDLDPFDAVSLSGQINVERPPEATHKMSVKLGEVEALIVSPIDSLSVEIESCPTLITSNIADCSSTAPPPAPALDYLYFRTDLCLTPTVTSVVASATEDIPGLKGMQVRSGVTFTFTGKGFGSTACQTTVSIGPASCSVTASSDTSVTCVLDDHDNVISAKALPFVVTVSNRGSASNYIEDYGNKGQVSIVPSISSFSPVQGSTAGGTSITISGSGFKAYDGTATVQLGSGQCIIDSITATAIMCHTQATPPSTAALSVFVSKHNIEAIRSNLIYTFNEESTPSFSNVTVNENTLNITGSYFGDSAPKVTIRMRRHEMHTEEVRREIGSSIIMNDDDNENSDPMNSDKYYNENKDFVEEYVNNEEKYGNDKEAQDVYNARQKIIHPTVFDELDFGPDFWGKFTNTEAKSYDESKRLGAWRIGGSSPKPAEIEETIDVENVRAKRRLRSNTYICDINFISSSFLSCSVPDIQAGSYKIEMSVAGLGRATAISSKVNVSPKITNISPSEGSINGEALLKISGARFTPGDVTVTIDGIDCPLEYETRTSLDCRVPAHVPGSVTVIVTSGGVSTTSPIDFIYSIDKSPVLASISPDSDLSKGTLLTLTGSNMRLSGSDPSVSVGGTNCPIISATNVMVECTSPDLIGGSHIVISEDPVYGVSNSNISVTYSFGITLVTPIEGGFGGIPISIAGSGFDDVGESSVTVCGNPCQITSLSSGSISCDAPAYIGSGTVVPCDVTVTNSILASETLVGGFTYKQSLTPSVTSISPKRGGTAGGTTLKITGSGFASSGNTVYIDGSPCFIRQESAAEIVCVTEAHEGSGTFPVIVEVPGSGFATTDEDGEFFYIDLWSSTHTWGGGPLPKDDDLVVIKEDVTILLDVSTANIAAIVIEGGHLVFDEEATMELVLRAGYIIIVKAGSLSIGSEDKPFTGKAVIELQGNAHSKELPIYGAKVLAVRNGTLDMHGAHIPITWTHLSSTANPGENTISLMIPVTWKPGDKIVIATTQHRFSKNENEVMTIESVSEDGLTLTLTEPLAYQHISTSHDFGGRIVYKRAEVGHLTRNVKFRGNMNTDFIREIEECEDEFEPGQFSPLNCYEGRYGNELGSDQFGGDIMFSGEAQNQDLVKGRIAYVEVTEAGQAFQLGRYPIHFHLVGDVSSSYIRGCSIYHTFNRAITIHAANNLRVQHNVVYDNMGHAIFTEDGVEENNFIEYNLAIYTRSSSSLLNVDITPASFWIVNPNNIVRHNAAAGGTHFGYWYRLERHPSGPSETDKICPNNIGMGQFVNNTAHSMGSYGLWIFSEVGYHPKSENCGGNDEVAVFKALTAWNCERGAEAVRGTNLQFHNFMTWDNEHSGMEMVEVKGGFGKVNGPGIFDSLVVGHSDPNGSCGDETSGIAVPKMEIFSISNTTFVNFDTNKCSALSRSSRGNAKQGGFRVQTMSLSFDNSPNKMRFQCQHEAILIDADGTLTGGAENTVVPSMGILPPESCQMDVAAVSVNPKVPGSICSGLNFLRVALDSDVEPDSLRGLPLIVYNSHGNVSFPYEINRLTTDKGWMGILFSGDTYGMKFHHSEQITNLSYTSETRFLDSDSYYLVEHEFIQTPDFFGTLEDQQSSTNAIPNPDDNEHGDYYWDNGTRTMTYIVKTSEPGKKRTVFDDRPVGDMRMINFSVHRCFYTGCTKPTPPPVPTGRPNETLRWSNDETWKEVPVGTGGHPDNDTYGQPVDGDEIVIPKGMWLIVDTVTPKLSRVYVYGVLEFEDGMDHTFEATIIYIQGGTVAAGLSEDAPFTSDLNIVLHGSLDPDDPDNVDMPMPDGVPNVGWKAIEVMTPKASSIGESNVIERYWTQTLRHRSEGVNSNNSASLYVCTGVFGHLSLHGHLGSKTWVKLGATASAGDSEITLAESVDSSWIGKEVMITTTSKESKETEIRTVIDVTGSDSILTLDSALNYEHLGESYTLSDNSRTFNMAAEVGLLSRNIRIEGNAYTELLQESFGGRILVSRFNQDGVDYEGKIQLSNVELKNMGQEGFTSFSDPRYSLALVGLGVSDGSNYVKKCSFNNNFNTAIGSFGSNNVTYEENVIYHTVGSGIRDHSSDNIYKRNLVSVMLFPGTYNGRNDEEFKEWFGAFTLDSATNTILEDNVVGGSEQAGYQTFGELCENDTLWYNNEVHGAIFGVMVWRKGAGSDVPECRRINNFYAWRIYDTAFYMQHHASLRLTGATAIDCKVGVDQIIYDPNAVDHKTADKSATIEDSVFVGASPQYTCDYQNSEPEIYDFKKKVLWSKNEREGNVAILFATFLSKANDAPDLEFHDPTSYPALFGVTYIRNVVFSDYDDRACGSDVALLTSPLSDDAIHPIFTSGLTFLSTPDISIMEMVEPNLDRINPSDCVDMTCDGHKKVIITDEDGSLLGFAGATATSVAEFEWGSNGVTDDRIPLPLRQNLDGTAVNATDKFPNKGIYRDSTCQLETDWRAWVCKDIIHRMMIIESMDSDTEIRRLSPIALIANPGSAGFVDLLNGPMDRGWCSGYTCQQRISTFYSVVASGIDYYEMAFTSTPPQVIRFHLLHSDPSETVLLRIFFPKPQRYDISVDGVYVAPKNIDSTVSSYQLHPDDPSNPSKYFPTDADDAGANYHQREYNFLHVLLRGGHTIEIKTTAMIILSTNVIVNANEFFKENIVSNVAAMLGISVDNIRVTDIIREDSRKRTDQEVVGMDFEVASTPASNFSGESLTYEELKQKASNLVNSFQSGNTTLTLASLTIQPIMEEPEKPGPPPTEEFASQNGTDLYSEIKQEEEEVKLNQSLTAEVYEKPGRAVISQGVPSKVVALTRFSEQPCITIQNSEEETLLHLGHESNPWQVGAVLTGGSSEGILLGINPVPYVNGKANFTGLSVNHPGDGYMLTFHVVQPESAPSLEVQLSHTFDAAQKEVLLILVSMPKYIHENKDFSVTMTLIDKDTGMPIDPAQLIGQTLKGTVKTNYKVKIQGNPSFTIIDGNISEFTLSGLRIPKAGNKYKLIVEGKVSPVGLTVSAKSKLFDVLPNDLTNPENKTIKSITMRGLKGKASVIKGFEDMFGDKVKDALDTQLGLVDWYIIKVKVRGNVLVGLKVSGSATNVKTSIKALCKAMKQKKLRLYVRGETFRMGQLYVDGKNMKKCKKINKLF